MPEFTKGPWKYNYRSGLIEGPKRIGICGVYGKQQDFTKYANARLIAAAPEMYEALREACTLLVIAADQARDAAKSDGRWSGVDEKLLRYAREGQAVIAKVEGREVSA